jgi:spermidine synthase
MAFAAFLQTKSPIVSILLQSFIAMMMVFFIPIMLLGMVSPFVIKLVSVNEQAMGDVSGRIFAVGTIGSFLGTFIPAIITIPTLGSRRTIVLFAFIMFLTAALGMMRKKYFLALIPFALVSIDGNLSTISSGKLLEARETPYQLVKVVEQANGLRFLQFNESTAVQSVYFPRRLAVTSTYYDVLTYIPELITARPFTVLNIGLAGGTVARNIKDLYGDQSRIIGVEIDPDVVSLGEKYLALGKPGIEVHTEDGRMFLKASQETYDVIILDAYSNQLMIPFHLTTKEFFELVHQHLAPGGIVAMNVNDIGEEGRIVQSIGKTAREVFPDVQIAHMSSALNYLLLAGDEVHADRMAKTAIGPEAMRKNAKESAAQLHEYRPENGMVLTDDLAPIEQMTDSMIWRYYRGETK